MKGSTRIPARCKAVLFGILALLGGEGAAQRTESDLSPARDCAEILLQALSDASLTREERIALLDQALVQSLNNFDPCQSAASNAGNGAAGGGGVQGSEGPAGGSGAESVAESAPVGDIQGDLPAAQAPRGDSAVDKAETTVPSKVDDPRAGTLSNGKLPEDIPPAENDDIIAKQFRQAAVEETDPVAKAKLWNEYRRYKNLPVHEVPET